MLLQFQFCDVIYVAFSFVFYFSIKIWSIPLHVLILVPCFWDSSSFMLNGLISPDIYICMHHMHVVLRGSWPVMVLHAYTQTRYAYIYNARAYVWYGIIYDWARRIHACASPGNKYPNNLLNPHLLRGNLAWTKRPPFLEYNFGCVSSLLGHSFDFTFLFPMDIVAWTLTICHVSTYEAASKFND